MNAKAIEELCQGEKLIFKKGDFIARQGETVNYLYYLSTGICLGDFVTAKGDEIIYDMRVADGSASCASWVHLRCIVQRLLTLEIL
mgnify:CR=1 FL=1|jgi:CRP-like cAMP-binding protein